MTTLQQHEFKALTLVEHANVHSRSICLGFPMSKQAKHVSGYGFWLLDEHNSPHQSILFFLFTLVAVASQVDLELFGTRNHLILNLGARVQLVRKLNTTHSFG